MGRMGCVCSFFFFHRSLVCRFLIVSAETLFAILFSLVYPPQPPVLVRITSLRISNLKTIPCIAWLAVAMTVPAKINQNGDVMICMAAGHIHTRRRGSPYHPDLLFPLLTKVCFEPFPGIRQR